MIHLSPEETEILYDVIEKITGTYQQGKFRKDLLLENVKNRMNLVGAESLTEYFSFVEQSETERAHFTSAVTIHTTSWFREMEHYAKMIGSVNAQVKTGHEFKIQVWCAGSSTGQEGYSAALALERIRAKFPQMDYEIFGTDIDPVSVATANKCIYNVNESSQIPHTYRQFISRGTGPMEKCFTLDKQLRKRCRFEVRSITDEAPKKDYFDFVFCRNVLIYFDPQKHSAVIGPLTRSLKNNGQLFLGHNESIFERKTFLQSRGPSVYQKTNVPPVGKKSVLIIEDDKVARTAMSGTLKRSGFEILEASNAEEADKFLNERSVDLVSLDIGLPGESGLSWLSRLRKRGVPTPVVIVSASDSSEAHKVFSALEKGAQEYFLKDQLFKDLQRYIATVTELTKDQSEYSTQEQASLRKSAQTFSRPDVILVGASTGGPEAIWKLLDHLDKSTPPVMVVQHTSPFFAGHFASTLARRSGLPVSGAIDGEVLTPGKIYLAHGDYHIGLEKVGKELRVKHSLEPKIQGHRPAVDHLFKSASLAKVKTLAVLLTGMGEDGATGMVDLVNTGLAENIVQNESTCVVYGMPKAAVVRGVVDYIGDIISLRERIDKRMAS